MLKKTHTKKQNKQLDHCVTANFTYLEMMMDADLHPHVIPVISEIPSKWFEGVAMSMLENFKA